MIAVLLSLFLLFSHCGVTETGENDVPKSSVFFLRESGASHEGHSASMSVISGIYRVSGHVNNMILPDCDGTSSHSKLKSEMSPVFRIPGNWGSRITTLLLTAFILFLLSSLSRLPHPVKVGLPSLLSRPSLNQMSVRPSILKLFFLSFLIYSVISLPQERESKFISALWSYKGTSQDKVKAIDTTKDGGFVTSSVKDSTHYSGFRGDTLVTKYYHNGSIAWSVLSSGEELGTKYEPIGIIELPNEDIVVVGTLTNPSAGSVYYRCFFSKFNSEKGSLIWSKYLGLNGTNTGNSYANSELCKDVALTNDGHFVVSGETYNHGSIKKAYLAKFDFNGKLISYHTIGHPSYHITALSFSVTQDSGLIFTTHTRGPYVIKLDSSMSIEFAISIYYNPTYGFAGGMSIIATSDGGFLFVGRRWEIIGAGPSGYSSPFLVKLMSNGTMEWARNLLDSENDYGTSIIEVGGNEPGYVLTIVGLGNTVGQYDVKIVKFRLNGTMFFIRRLGDTNYDSTPSNGIVKTIDEEVLVAIEYYTIDLPTALYPTRNDLQVVKIGNDFGNEFCVNQEAYTENVTTELPTIVDCKSSFVVENVAPVYYGPINFSFWYDVKSEYTVTLECRECSDERYFGEWCEHTYEFKCFGISGDDLDRVCGGHGQCRSEDDCLCSTGYSTTADYETPCSSWSCGIYPRNNNKVCNKRGVCVSSQYCACLSGYEGSLCETWSCGYPYNNKMTCSGNGECLSPDNCDCNGGYAGDKCETNTLYASVMAPILTISGIGLFFVIVCVFLFVVCCSLCCCFCLALVFCFVVFVFCFASCFLLLLMAGLCALTCGLRFRMKKFKKLKNFDILLKEQEMDDDTTVAHVRIDKSLFEIPMKEIKLERVLGEGGSSSIVYLASWKQQKVAFKCFKTRTVCVNQVSFDEFEREVSVLGSISHPHIIRYFGSSLEPPRVGIVMEFCENGDLENFVFRYKRDQKSSYPFDQKMRMILETSQAMEYLHSRSIIHRDLKLENVLIDSTESCKLMDFGLSKIVDRMSLKKTSRIGTSFYMSPEIVNSGHYDEKTDVYSMAIFIFILLTENFLPYGENMQHVEIRVANDEALRPNLKELETVVPPSHLDWVRDIVEKSWSHCSKERYQISEICRKIEEMMEIVPPKELFGKNKTKKEEIKIEEKDEKEEPLEPLDHVDSEEDEKIVSIPIDEWKDNEELNGELNKEYQELQNLISEQQKRIDDLEKEIDDE